MEISDGKGGVWREFNGIPGKVSSHEAEPRRLGLGLETVVVRCRLGLVCFAQLPLGLGKVHGLSPEKRGRENKRDGSPAEHGFSFRGDALGLRACVFERGWKHWKVRGREQTCTGIRDGQHVRAR